MNFWRRVLFALISTGRDDWALKVVLMICIAQSAIGNRSLRTFGQAIWLAARRIGRETRYVMTFPPRPPKPVATATGHFQVCIVHWLAFIYCLLQAGGLSVSTLLQPATWPIEKRLVATALSLVMLPVSWYFRVQAAKAMDELFVVWLAHPAASPGIAATSSLMTLVFIAVAYVANLLVM